LSVLYKTYIATLNSLSTVTTLTLTSLNNITYILSKTIISVFTGNRKNINQLKVDFFTTFFKNFLTWNYLLNSFSKNQTNKAFKDLVVSKRNNNFKITPPKLNFLKNNTNLLSLLGLFKTHLLSDLFLKLKIIVYKSFSFSWYYLSGFTFILFIDACLTDDEPLWEPIEWSLVQTWILFIFSFAWIAENLIVSRYGSYAGRDKRVWMAWYKTFWLIEGYYVLNYGVAVILVIVPFYFELNYNLSFIYSWWNWFSKVFFLSSRWCTPSYYLCQFGYKLTRGELGIKKP